MRRCHNCGALNIFDEVECANCGILMVSTSGRPNYNPYLKVRECERIITGNAKVAITLKDGSQKEVEIRNISAKGISVAANFSLEINEEVDVTMVLPPSQEVIRRKATVCWRMMATENIWKFGLNFGDDKIDITNLFKKQNDN